HFELTTAAGTPITSFTAAEVASGVIQFVHDGSDSAPSYKVSVSDGTDTSTPAPANINFTGIDDSARISVSAGVVTVVDSDGDTAADLTVTLEDGYLVFTENTAAQINAGVGTTPLTLKSVKVDTPVGSLTGIVFQLGALSDALSVADSIPVPVQAATNADLESVSVSSGATLSIAGALAANVTVSAGGKLDPTGLNASAGSLTLSSTSELLIAVSSAAAHDRITSSSINLGGATLTLSGTPTVNAGDRFVIVSNTSASALTSTFDGLPEGAQVSDNFLGSGKTARITYQGGDGNDVAIVVDGVYTPTDYVSTSGDNDLTLQLSGGNIQTLSGSTVIDSRPVNSVSAIALNGGAGSDNFTLNLGSGLTIPAGGITINGGESTGDDDKLTIQGGSFATGNFAYSTPGGAADFSGSVKLGGGTINFTGLEPLVVTSAMNAISITLPAGGNPDAALANSGGNSLTLSGSTFETTTFNVASATSVTINGGAGDDSLTINSLSNVAAGAPVKFKGNAGSDALAISVPSSNVIINHAGPDANGYSGSVSLVSISKTIQFEGVDSFSYAPATAATSVTVNLPTTSPKTVTLAESGSNLTFSSLDVLPTTTIAKPAAGGSLTVDMNSGADTLNLNGLTLNGDLSIQGNTGTDDIVDILGDTGVTGNLDIDAEVVIQSAKLTVQGTSLFTGKNITLNNSANDFQGAVAITASGSIQLTDTSAITLDAITVSGSGSATISAQNSVQVTQPISSGLGSLSITSVSGSITAGTNGQIVSGGLATFNAPSGDISLANPNNNFSSVKITKGNTVTLRDTNSFVLAGADVATLLDLTAGTTITQSAAITGTGAFKISGGTTTLSLMNTFTGATTVSSGATLNLNAANTLTSNSITVNSGAMLNVSAAGALPSSATVTVDGGTLNVNANNTVAGLTLKNGGTISGSGTLTVNGPINLEAGTVSAVLAGNGSLTKSTSGTVTLNAASTYSGSTTITAGTLTAGIANALPTATSLTVDATFNQNGFAQTVSSLAGSGTVQLGSGALTVNGSDSTTFSGAINGTGGTLTKSGSGVLTLSGASGYTGATVVDAGGLVVNGSLATASVTLNGTSSLSGTGSIAGSLTANTGTSVSPGGTSIGTLSVGSATFNAGSTLVASANSSSADKLSSAGAVTLLTTGLGVTLNFTATGTFADGIELVLVEGSSRTGTFANYLAKTPYTLGSSDKAWVSYTATKASLFVNVQPTVTLGAGTLSSYTEQHAATAIAPNLVLSDSDSSLENTANYAATVTVSGGDASDALSIDLTPWANLSVTGNGTQALTISALNSSATLADFQAALRAVKFANVSQNPSSAIRTFAFVFNDGAEASLSSSTTSSFTTVNNPPTITGGTNETHTETDSGFTKAGTLSFHDPDSSVLITKSLSVSGTGDISGRPTNSTLNGFMTYSATGGTLNWIFDSGTEAFDYLSNGQQLVLTYTFTVSDGQYSDSEDVVVTITGTNDGPDITVGSSDSDAASLTEGNTGLSTSGTLTVT
ncbi:MAG: beta strand repeat-containing protein, partial [Aureliella sp.]